MDGIARRFSLFRTRSRALRVLLLTLALTCLVPAQAAETAPATVIIVDSSGSMAAREADGQVRLDAARESIVETLGAWPVEAELAVVAYGHRRTSDCSDIETIVPLGPLSVGEVKARLATLRARGKTPLSASLRTAAALLPADGGDIVLVSDGLETCDADPCAVAEALRAANANVSVHVIGFGVTQDERTQLQCIADNGGGRYLGADDATGLATALGEVAAVVAVPEPPPEPVVVAPQPIAPLPEPMAPPPSTPKQVSLTATAGALGEIVDAPVAWVVTAASGNTVYEGESRGLGLSLPPGDYRVSAAAANASGNMLITVSDKDVAQSFAVEVPAGRLDLTLAANPKSEPFGDLETVGVAWALEPLDGQPAAEIPALAKPSLLLAPGNYRVTAALKGMAADGNVEVVPGKPVALVLDFELGTLMLEAAVAEDGSALDDDQAFDWRIGAGDSATEIMGESRPHLTLEAGRYPVTLNVSGVEMTAEAEVIAGEETVERVVIKSGELGLSARLGPDTALLDDWRDTTWTVTAVAALGVAAGASATDEALIVAQPRLTLMPGTWRVGLQSGMAYVEREVTVGSESATDLVVDIGAGRLVMNAKPENGAQPINIVYSVFAFGADGAAAEAAAYSIGSSSDATVILPAGRWWVTALDDAQRAAQADIDLTAGQELRLDLSLK